jgi:geranylgeranyl reductase family protein
MHDVIVIGAGPAGSSAAFSLAEAGLKVMVLEKARLPRYKTCGGGVIVRAANLLPFSINPVNERELVRADIFDHDNDLHFIEERSEDIIFMVMRSDFDNFILSKAVEQGAVVHDNSNVVGIENFNDCVVVKTNKETYKAKFVIAADGATGISGKISGRKSKSLKVAAIEIEITTNQNIFNKYKNSVRFDYGLVPHGYAWVFPKEKHLSIGAAFMKKTNQSLHKWLEKYFEILNIQKSDIINQDKHGYFIPLYSNEKKCHSGRILYAGDALGLADPITAEGISYAIESGQLAAKAIINSDFNLSSVKKNYKQNLKPVFKELNSAKFLSNFVFGPRQIRKFVFNHYGKRLSELMADIISGKKTYSELVHNPISYLKLLRPGYFF